MQSLPDKEIVIMHVARHLAVSETMRGNIMKSQTVKEITDLANSKVKEWLASILNIYATNCVKIIKDDVIAQVRPSHAATTICSIVYGLDVSL